MKSKNSKTIDAQDKVVDTHEFLSVYHSLCRVLPGDSVNVNKRTKMVKMQMGGNASFIQKP